MTIQAQILDLLKDLQEENTDGDHFDHPRFRCRSRDGRPSSRGCTGSVCGSRNSRRVVCQLKHPYTCSLLNSILKKIHKTVNCTWSKAKFLHWKICHGRVVGLPHGFLGFLKANHEANPVLHEVAPDHLVRCTCYKHFHFRDEEGEV